MRLLPPPTDYWYTPSLFLAGPGALHENALSAFSRSQLGRANNFLFLLLLNPVHLEAFFLIHPSALALPLLLHVILLPGWVDTYLVWPRGPK